MNWIKIADKKPQPGKTVLICVKVKATDTKLYFLAYMSKDGLGWRDKTDGKVLYATPMWWCEITDPEAEE